MGTLGKDRLMVQERDPMKLVTYRQDEDGSLVFAVRVFGLPASSESPKQVAERIVRLWTDAMEPRTRVIVEPPDEEER